MRQVLHVILNQDEKKKAIFSLRSKSQLERWSWHKIQAVYAVDRGNHFFNWCYMTRENRCNCSLCLYVYTKYGTTIFSGYIGLRIHLMSCFASFGRFLPAEEWGALGPCKMKYEIITKLVSWSKQANYIQQWNLVFLLCAGFSNNEKQANHDGDRKFTLTA